MSSAITIFVSLALGAAVAFQLFFNGLFVIVAAFRSLSRKRRELFADPPSTSDCLQWLFMIPVVSEAHLLRRCIRHTAASASPRTTIVVALDGKNLDAVDACEGEIERFVKEWRATGDRRDGAQTYQGHSQELELVDALLRADTEEDADRVESLWRSLVPIQRVPTTMTCEGLSRRKGEALNLVLSLCGKRCIWLRFCGKEILVVGETVKELRERYDVVIAHYGQPYTRKLFSVPTPDYYLCIDVDEVVDPEAIARLQRLAARHRDLALIQCKKQDGPISSSLMGYAFQAYYASWFHWEAAWPSRTGPHGDESFGCSYYGSLAAVRVAHDTLEPQKVELRGGQVLRGSALFPEGYSIEDYAFFSNKLLRSPTLLTGFTAGKGDAPYDIGALFSLWARWTKDNVRVFLYSTLPSLIRSPGGSFVKKIALVYHGMSWFAYANVAVISMLVGLAAATGSRPDYRGLWVAAVAVFALEVYRRCLTVPGIKLWQRLIRLPVEYLLFPIAARFVLAGVLAPWKILADAPMATPRDGQRRQVPFWVTTCYALNGFALGYGWIGLTMNSGHVDSLQLLCLGLFSIWFASSLLVLMGDEYVWQRSYDGQMSRIPGLSVSRFPAYVRESPGDGGCELCAPVSGAPHRRGESALLNLTQKDLPETTTHVTD